MNSINRFPNRKALNLARAALILAAATLVASCVTPNPPKSEDFKLTKTPAERQAEGKKEIGRAHV